MAQQCTRCADHEGSKRCWHVAGYEKGGPFGVSWQAGDVLGCTLDMEAATMAFSLNGAPLGVAFTDIDCTARWYPAVSLNEGQHVG